MIIKENKEMVSVHFESMLELMGFKPEAAQNRINFNRLINNKKSVQNGIGKGWIGKSEYYKDIVSMALLGDQDSYKISLKRMSELKSGTVSTKLQTIQKSKRIKTKSDMGDELDIHKVYQGNLSQAWSKTKRLEVDVKHHLVTIFLNINGSWKIKVSDTIWRCALILKLVKEIQLAGKSVKIVVGGVVCHGMEGSDKLLSTSITVKKYNEKLTPERLAAMTNIGFYRTFGFAAKECQNRVVDSSGGGSREITRDSMPIHLQEEVEKGHTKPVFLSGITTKYEAMNELSRAFEQMKSFN